MPVGSPGVATIPVEDRDVTMVYTLQQGWVPKWLADLNRLTIVAPGTPTTGGSGQLSMTTIAIPPGGGSVLGFTVPRAAAVALPSFVGGALGKVRMSEGMRTESGGSDQRVYFGPSALPLVRMDEVM